jgi:tetratricopeptide (TPR) repeat protein
VQARQLYPLSHQFLYLRGAIHQQREEWPAAKTALQNSLAIHPRHLASLQALGLLHLRLGAPRLGELALRAAIRLEPNNHISWYNLGLVMEVALLLLCLAPHPLAVYGCRERDSGKLLRHGAGHGGEQPSSSRPSSRPSFHQLH